MSGNLTVVIPLYNGHQYIHRLVNSIPNRIPIIIVDDCSDQSLGQLDSSNVRVVRLDRKGYFAGAVNRGIRECFTDVLVLNQDTWFENENWFSLIEEYRDSFAFIGERIRGDHPSFGDVGYIHGTCMFMRRDAIDMVGLLDAKNYPLWGNTAEWQWRVARAGFDVLPLAEIPGFRHERKANERYGSSIKKLLVEEPEKKNILVQTPPLISIIVPCYNYGRYLSDCINSLIGGKTSLGEMPGQTVQSFEIIIVDDASTDNSREFIKEVADIKKGIRYYFLEKNVGTAQTLNFGISKAVGKYITFLSADDMREANSLEKLLEACEASPHSFAYDDVWLVSQGKRIKKWILEEYDFDKLIWKNQVHAGILFPKKAWEETGGYPAIMGDGREDWAFNVALGIKGWCGIHVNNLGYLYRREKQNRTETNTSSKHRQYFLDKIMNLFSEIYGGHRPVACCGKGRKSTPSMKSSSSSQNGIARMATSMVGQAGMTKIEYTGSKMNSSWHGEVTHRDYIFGEDRARGWVDNRDVDGFLKARDNKGNYIFKRVDAPKQVKQSEPVAVESNEKEVVVLKGQSVGRSADAVAVVEKQPNFPDPIDMTVEEIKDLELDLGQWKALYSAEMAGRNRKGAVAFIEEKIANWNS